MTCDQQFAYGWCLYVAGQPFPYAGNGYAKEGWEKAIECHKKKKPRAFEVKAAKKALGIS